MELEKFLELREPRPEDYNFEFADLSPEKADSYEKLGVFRRYCMYKACDGSVSDDYPHVKTFAEKAKKMYGFKDSDSLKLANNIYSELWGRQKTKNYGPVFNISKFKMFDPDTMNSAQTTLDKVIEPFFDGLEEDRKKIKKKPSWQCSKELMLEFYANDKYRDDFEGYLNGITGLTDYLDAYHTIGNFVLVPKCFNQLRANTLSVNGLRVNGDKVKIEDYWDRSLMLLKKEKAECYGEIFWNNDFFIPYINKFFLWDYVDGDGRPIRISNFYDNNDIEELKKFLAITTNFIKRRGKFMVAMLKINKDNPDFYTSLVKDVFNVNTIYKGYKEVIDKIKEEPFYESIKEEIDTLDLLK